MARNPTNYLPNNTDPLGDYESRLHNIVGGNPNFFRYGRFGFLTDSSRLKEHVEGGIGAAPSNAFTGGGSPSHSFSGGSTSSDPGKRNWATLQRNLGRASDMVWGMVNWQRESRAQRRANEAQKWQDTMDNYSKSFDPDYNLPGVYQQSFGQYQGTLASQRTQTLQNAYQNAYGQPDAFSNAYEDMLNSGGMAKAQNLAGAPLKASQNVTAGLFAANNPTPIAGASSPIRGRKNAPVNLLNPPGSAPAPATPMMPAPPAAPVANSRTQARKGTAKKASPAPKRTSPAPKLKASPAPKKASKKP